MPTPTAAEIALYEKRQAALVPNANGDGFDIAVHIVSSDVALGGGGGGGGGLLAETLWTDDSGAFFIRKDDGTTVSWKTPAGGVSVAPTNPKPAGGSGVNLDRSEYQATSAGTGYSVGDLIVHIAVTNPTTGTVLGSYWYNATTAAVITAPSAANVALLENVLPTGAATAAKQDTGNTALAAIQASTAAGATAANQTSANTKLDTVHTDLQATNTKLDTLHADNAAQATAAKQDTGNTTLASILSTLQAQHSVADTLWTDNTGAFFVRRDVIDEDSNTFVVSYTDPAGSAATPGTGLRPVGRDATLDAMETFYDVSTAGTGYSIGDVLARVVVISNATGAIAVATSAWVNMTTGAVIATPSAANIVERPKGDATAALQTAGNTSLTAIAADIHTMATDTSPAVTVGKTATPTAAFTRPANTTAYAAGQQVNNNATAATVAPMQFTVVGANGGSGMIRKARIRKTGTNITNAQFRLHLFKVAPTVATTGDGGAFTLVSGMANYVGAFDITVDRALADGSVGSGVPHTGSDVNFVCAAGDTKLYGLLEALGAYTPASAETFNVDLELIPNA